MTRKPSRFISMIAIGGVLVAAAARTVSQLLAPPTTPPAYTEARPTIHPEDMVSHTETIVVNVPLEQYALWSSQAPLETLLQGSDSIPSVLRTEIIQGEWGQVGARRRVVLSDGHYATEEILANDPPSLFRYQVWGYTNFARFATDYAIGEFRHEAVGNQTRVTWTYAFQRKSPLTNLFVQFIWADYMRTVLEVMKAESEATGKQR